MKIINGYGKRVAMVRVAKGMSKVGFAKQALSPNASAQNIGRIEDEAVTPRLDTLRKIASFGGVDLTWLAEGKVPVKPTDVVRLPGVGQRIAAARQSRNLTCLALAKASQLGSSSKNVSRLETGECYPRRSTLMRIAKSLKVSYKSLAFGA